MYVKVRTMDGSQTAVLTLSKLTTVLAVRKLVEEKFGVPPSRQRLFFRGKQMEDGYNMFDYNININDVIQLMIKPVLEEITSKNNNVAFSNSDTQSKESSGKASTEEDYSATRKSRYYRVGDLVDAKYLYDGTWWEAVITDIVISSDSKEATEKDDGMFYKIKFETDDAGVQHELKLEHIRPRARVKIPLSEVKTNDVIMVNYNVESPEQRGFWYDCQVTKVVNARTEKKVIGTIFIGDGQSIEECHIRLADELFKTEQNCLICERDLVTNDLITHGSPVKRQNGPTCSTCNDNPRRKCKDCGCNECGGKENPEKQLMCDECDMPFHIYCLKPPLEVIPDVEDWFCHNCKNDDTEIVKAGENLKESKKKAKMASSLNSSTRDWGKGFACAGRTKVCTIVKQNHFGPIPGVEVGTLWKYRLQASEAGVHRPHVAGIHGRENEGAYSIVLSGGYEDDEDNGDSFTYTGSGGRDLSGNKRTAEQSCDQKLARMNKALALNCNVPLNAKGAEAKDWRGGKPVRVIRNSKGRKHSKYAPEDGNRYDGIYKVVKYWQDRGQSGFKVWRYLLRRDDEVPAPWTKQGAKRSKELGLEMQYPSGYLEAQREKEMNNSCSDSGNEENKEPKKGRKRKAQDRGSPGMPSPKPKKYKASVYKVEEDTKILIDSDIANAKLWNECMELATEGKVKFLAAVEERFECICCQCLATRPVTLVCGHNVCLDCLKRSFKAEVYVCPACRHELGQKYSITVNTQLGKTLRHLFPGYDSTD